MELIDDNWTVIFGYLTSNDLIILKGTNKHLHRLISGCGRKLNLSIFEVVYRNYFSLFKNYLYNDSMPLQTNRSNLSYCAGLGCSTTFTRWLRQNDLLDNSKLIKGALRSANKKFITYVHHLNLAKIQYDWIIRSLSIDIVEWASTLIDSKSRRVFYIATILPDKLEKKLGLNFNITTEYVLYLTKLNGCRSAKLFPSLLEYDVSLIQELLASDYTPNFYDLQTVLDVERLDFAERIIKTAPSCLDNASYIVHSINAYEYALSKGIDIHNYDTLVAAVRSGNKDFVTYLYGKGVVFTDEMLGIVYSLGETNPNRMNMMNHVMSLGYNFPLNIYEFMNEEGCIDIDLDLFIYLHEHGYHDPVETPKYIFCASDINVIRAYINLGLDIPSNAYEYICGRDDHMEVIHCLHEKGAQLPEDICNLLVSSHDDCVPSIQYLISLGCKVTDTTLLRAVESENIEAVRFLVDKVGVTLDIISKFSIRREVSDEAKMEIISILVEAYAKSYFQ